MSSEVQEMFHREPQVPIDIKSAKARCLTLISNILFLAPSAAA